MIAIILAAGISKRLRPLTNAIPKCLLDIGGTTLLSHHLNLLEMSAVSKLLIVTGFNTEAVEAELFRKAHDFAIEVIRFPDFATTQPIDGFLLTEKYIDGDFLLLNSDIYFSATVLDKLIRSSTSAIAIDSSAPFVLDEMFVNYTDDMLVTDISKKLTMRAGNQGRSVQISRFTSADGAMLFDRARAIAGQPGIFYPAQAYDALIEKGHFSAIDVAGEFWQEMDTLEDYQALVGRLSAGNI